MIGYLEMELGHEILWARRMDYELQKMTIFLIHTLELKLWHFEIFPYVCIGKPYICNISRPHTTWVGVAMRTYVCDDFYQICSKSQVDGACLHCMALLCI